MATKLISTRIKNKVDLLSNWQSSTTTLLDGESALVRVPTGNTHSNPVTGKEEPVVELLLKVGDGETTFADLPWLSAKASDVYNWAKAADVKLTTGTNTKTIDFVDSSNKVIKSIALNYLAEADIAQLRADVTSNKSAIEILNKDNTTSGSIAYSIKSALDALDFADSSASTDSAGSTAGNFVTVVTQTDGKISVKKRAIAEIDLPTISASKIKVSDDKTLATRLGEIDSFITNNTNGHTDAQINTLIDTKINALDGGTDSGTSGTGKYVSKVTQTNGKVATTYSSFPTAGTSTAGIVKLGATGGAATYDSIYGTDGNGGINKQVETNTADITNIKAAITNGVRFIGTVSAVPGDTTKTVNGITVKSGDIVIYNGQEYICIGVTDSTPSWEQLGDATRIGNLETKINNLDYTTANAVASTHKFASQVTQTDGKISVTYTQPAAADISYGTGSTVKAALDSHDSDIAVNNDKLADVTSTVGTSISSAINGLNFSSPSASDTTATSFIDTISLSNGTFSVTKKKLPSASTSITGIVKLSSATNSTSNALAATAGAVKSAYDLAGTADSKATNIQADYVRFNSTDSKLYVGTSGTDEIIFDCGGAE